MGRVLKLEDYREKVLNEPFPKFSDEELIEFLNEGVEKAIEHVTERAVKRALYEAEKELKRLN